MTAPPTPDERRARASIDGRFAFALAAFAAGFGLLCLLERIGLPARALRAFDLMFVLGCIVVIAALMRTMRISYFYAAGRRVPAPYAGLALAGLIVALALPFIAAVPDGVSLASIVAGFGCGLACVALVGGPLLRKTGAFSVPDLVAARFPNLALRLATVLVAAVVGALVGLAGYETAVRNFAAFGFGTRPSGAAIFAVVLALIVVPGGASGCVWAATAGAVVLLFTFGLPLAMTIAGADAGPPLPMLDDGSVWRLAIARLGRGTFLLRAAPGSIRF